MRGLGLIVVAVVGCRSTVATEAPSAVASVEPSREVTVGRPAVVVVADRDADGVADGNDGCPDEAEDADGFEDGDGCVDRDNDRDGVVDAFEWKDGRWTNCDYKEEGGVRVDCRDRPEDLDGVDDADGCPDVVTFDHCRVTMGIVRYDRRGVFTQEAAAELDAVAKAIREAPGIDKLYVDGHIEPSGDAMAARRATYEVAARALEELVARGVARERLEVRGFGFTAPIGGGEASRRVEFKLERCGLPPVGSNVCM